MPEQHALTSLAAVALNLFPGLLFSGSLAFAILVTYSILLFVLCVYGVHRFWLSYTYLRWRRNIPPSVPDPALWPAVTVQLPIFNERYVVERLLDAVARFDYPRELLQIQVLDDSTDDTQEIVRACVKNYESLGLSIQYMHRDDRTGYKAGALEAGLQSATGEFIAIFDADFLPAPNFLRRMIPYFTGPKIAAVQARWTYLNRGSSMLTKVEGLMLDGHFVMEQGARSRSGAFFNFNGTAGIWRRTAIDDAGGWQHDTLTEDTDLSYRIQLRGWRLLYVPSIECLSELPVELNAFKAQQARWSKGLVETAKKMLSPVLRSGSSVRVKAEAFFHLTGALSSLFMVLLMPLMVPVMVLRPGRTEPWLPALDLLGLASTIALIAFYILSQRELYAGNWWKTILFLPLLVSVSVGLAPSNAKAGLEALLGIKSDFVRTSKLNIQNSTERWDGKRYFLRSGWLPYLEIVFGVYFSYALLLNWRSGNWLNCAFMELFNFGFFYTGFTSLFQPQFARIRQWASRFNSREIASPSVFPGRRVSAEELAYFDAARAAEVSAESPEI
jgi:cellulose synthase/poly-beta-1,6-N-acetylglucosamine synthase-like glycosyltransferase